MTIENYILKFGKYNGKTFNYVLKKDYDYCKWFLINLDYNFATYDRKLFYDFLVKNKFYFKF